MTACSRCGAELDSDDAPCPDCEALDGLQRMIGQVMLGVYEITGVLGQGGMSVVYKATHRLTEQVVALKILPPELAVHAAIRARFLEEARALARLEHPNIVRLYHFGDEGGHFVLAMQYVDGENFEKKIMRWGRVPWRLTARIGCEILSALDYAHGRGVVHRDIKPSNILVRADGSSMVMDFGIAKMAQSSRLTQTGQTMGTVRYMSPEQVRGQHVGPGTDIYSLGVTLYEGLAGDTPFDGDTHFEIMSKHLSEQPPPLRARGFDVPAAFEDALMKAMSKDPAERFAEAREFRVALDSVLALDTGMEVAAGAEAAADADAPVAAVAVAPAEERVIQAVSLVTPAAEGREITGIASTLEPEIDEPARARRRPWLWIGLASVVATAALATAGVIWWQRADRPAAAAPRASAVAPTWPEPLVVPDLQPAVDERFEGPESVRVIAGRGVDAAHVAGAYTRARARFLDYVRGRQPGAVVQVNPLNLVVAPSSAMCDPALYAPDPVVEKCATRRFRSVATQGTLYVLAGPEMETINLPEAVASYLCITTSDLARAGCGRLLGPYFDELEKPE